ncbi:MAG: hypothetical protein JRD43_01330 [Deltaproteobacteria bacterium]|nr:hypothetical protein [Deltaproteobacteria bacterium]
MGTDRVQAYRGKCPCGSGLIDIKFCTPDHPWPTNSKWFESKIDCETCNKIYSLEEKGQYYGLVEKKRIIEREHRYETYNNAKDDLMSSKQVQEIIIKFRTFLDGQRSMAACHRFLSGNGLLYESYSTFIKHWNGADSWVSKSLRAENLEKVLSALGIKNDYITKAVSDLKRLWEEYKRPLPFHGDPLFNTSNYV